MRITDTTLPYNYIYNDNFQFAYKYVYQTGEESKLSPYSAVSYGQNEDGPIAGSPLFDFTYVKNNVLQVSTNIDPLAGVKTIKFFYRKNGGDWIKFQEENVEGQTFYQTNINSAVSGTTLQNEEVNNSVPILSDCLAAKDNFIFLNSLQEGYTLEDSTAQTNVSWIDDATPAESFIPSFKKGGNYRFGIAYHDKFGNISQVDAVVDSSAPYSLSFPSSPLNQRRFPFAQIEISGQPPSWARRYSIVRTRNNFNSDYMQIPVYIQFNAGIKDPETDFIESQSDYYLVGDRLFRETLPTEDDDYVSVYLQMPKEIPLVPNQDYFVRIVSDIGVDKIEKVISVQGNWIEVGNFGVNNWRALAQTNPAVYAQGTGSNTGWIKVLVEIFRPEADLSSDIFYEIVRTEDSSPIYPVSNPGTELRGFTKTSILAYGDTFQVNRQVDPYNFHFNKINITRDGDRYKNINGSALDSFVETPIIAAKRSAGLDELSADTEFNAKTFGIDIILQQIVTSYTFDYSKITEELGRVTTIVDQATAAQQDTTIRWSNRYVENSNIFGLNKFDALDAYVVPSERSRIKRLEVVGDALIAIHERSATTLLINENIITSASGDEQITITDNVIGYDRELRGGYGTIHPESVTSHGSKAFWFDASKGEFVRYSLNGITPLGRTYKMRNYLREMADQVISQDADVISGYDPYTDIAYLSARGKEGFDDFVFGQEIIYSGESQQIDISQLDDLENYQMRITITRQDQLITINDPQVTIRDQNGTIRHLFLIPRSGPIQDFILDIDYNDYESLTISVTSSSTLVFNIGFYAFNDNVFKKTIAFVDKQGEERFLGEFDFFPDFYCKINNKLYSFLDGQPHVHGEGEYNTFYGEKFPSMITIPHNEFFSSPKSYKGMSIESSEAWETILSTTNLPNDFTLLDSLEYPVLLGGQQSSLVSTNFFQREGNYYADFFRDELKDGNKFVGDFMYGKIAYVNLYNENDNFCSISNINVAFIPSLGNRRI
jgi:hypothetical protein